MKHVVVIVEIKPQDKDQIFVLSDAFVSSVKQEEGNLNYYFMKSIRHENIYIYTGTWKDEVAFQAHMRSEHFKNFIPQIGAYLENISVEMCDNIRS